MARTLAQKIIARAAGLAQVAPGEIVTCKVDLAPFHDSSGPRPRKPGARVRDPSTVVRAAC